MSRDAVFSNCIWTDRWTLWVLVQLLSQLKTEAYPDPATLQSNNSNKLSSCCDLLAYFYYNKISWQTILIFLMFQLYDKLRYAIPERHRSCYNVDIFLSLVSYHEQF